MVTMDIQDVGSEINIDSFLNLFVTQLQYLNPLDLQRSASEHEQQPDNYLTTGCEDVVSLQVDQLSMSSTFIGKTITYIPQDGRGYSNNTATGIVEGVTLKKDGMVSFIVGGNSVPLANFVEVPSPSQGMLARVFEKTWKR